MLSAQEQHLLKTGTKVLRAKRSQSGGDIQLLSLL